MGGKGLWIFQFLAQLFSEKTPGIALALALPLSCKKIWHFVISLLLLKIFFFRIMPLFWLRLFILYQASYRRALAPACGALVFFFFISVAGHIATDHQTTTTTTNYQVTTTIHESSIRCGNHHCFHGYCDNYYRCVCNRGYSGYDCSVNSRFDLDSDLDL